MKTIVAVSIAIFVLGGCASRSKHENTNSFYLTPLKQTSTKISGVDLVSGGLTLQTSDISPRKMLSLGRVYSSDSIDLNQTLGNFALSLDKQIDPAYQYDQEPVASKLYASPQKACEDGWSDIAPKVLLGKLEGDKAIYNADKELCDIYEDSTIKASLPIKDNTTHALVSDKLKVVRNADGTELLFFQDKKGIWQNATKSPVSLSVSDSGYTVSLPSDTTEEKV